MATVRVTARSRGAADPAGELSTLATSLAAMPATIVDAGGTAATTAILDSVRSQRGTLSVSGLGATLTVSATPGAAGASASTTIRPTPAGAWALVDSGARAHTQRRRKGMPTTYGVYSKVKHPGTAGDKVWAPARAAADTAVDSAVDKLLTELAP